MLALISRKSSSIALSSRRLLALAVLTLTIIVSLMAVVIPSSASAYPGSLYGSTVDDNGIESAPEYLCYYRQYFWYYGRLYYHTYYWYDYDGGYCNW